MSKLYSMDSTLFQPERAREIIEVLCKPSYDGPEDYAKLGVLSSPAFKQYALAVNTNSNQKLKLQSYIEEYFRLICLKEGIANHAALARKCLDLVCSSIKLPLCVQKTTVTSARVTLTTTNKLPERTPIVSNYDLENYGHIQLYDAIKTCAPIKFIPTDYVSQHTISGTFIPNLFKAQVKLLRDVINRAKEVNITVNAWWSVI